MDKTQKMVADMAIATAEYANKHNLNNSEAMNALAHLYVVYGFTVKSEEAEPQTMKFALVDCVSKSCDFMMEMMANAEKA